MPKLPLEEDCHERATQGCCHGCSTPSRGSLRLGSLRLGSLRLGILQNASRLRLRFILDPLRNPPRSLRDGLPFRPRFRPRFVLDANGLRPCVLRNGLRLVTGGHTRFVFDAFRLRSGVLDETSCFIATRRCLRPPGRRGGGICGLTPLPAVYTGIL